MRRQTIALVAVATLLVALALRLDRQDAEQDRELRRLVGAADDVFVGRLVAHRRLCAPESSASFAGLADYLEVEVERTLRGEATGLVRVHSYANQEAIGAGDPPTPPPGRYLFLADRGLTSVVYDVDPSGDGILPLADPERELHLVAQVEALLAEPPTRTPTAWDPALEATSAAQVATLYAEGSSRGATPTACWAVTGGTPAPTDTPAPAGSPSPAPAGSPPA